MDTQTPRTVFAVVCLVGAVVIAGAAVYEVGRQRRGEGLISPLHFRCRMFSAALWLAILLALAYGVTFEWPRDKNDVVAITNLQGIFQGAGMLILLASLLFGADLFLTLQVRASMKRRGARDINKLAREEIARLKKTGQE